MTLLQCSPVPSTPWSASWSCRSDPLAGLRDPSGPAVHQRLAQADACTPRGALRLDDHLHPLFPPDDAARGCRQPAYGGGHPTHARPGCRVRASHASRAVGVIPIVLKGAGPAKAASVMSEEHDQSRCRRTRSATTPSRSDLTAPQLGLAGAEAAVAFVLTCCRSGCRCAWVSRSSPRRPSSASQCSRSVASPGTAGVALREIRTQRAALVRSERCDSRLGHCEIRPV